jgi:hypothetical protein
MILHPLLPAVALLLSLPALLWCMTIIFLAVLVQLPALWCSTIVLGDMSFAQSTSDSAAVALLPHTCDS